MGLKKIAIVVQRCHPEIVGGSEALAWHYAQLLSRHWQVEVLTTTALDYTTWENQLPEGMEPREGITLRRFPVTIGRQPYWHHLYGRFLQDFHQREQPGGEIAWRRKWTIALQEEIICYQGPYSVPLVEFLKQHHGQYEKILLVTYLYPTSYFALQVLPRSKVILVPTLHDEPLAYLDIFKFHYGSLGHHIWLAQAERQLQQQLWGESAGQVVGMAIGSQLYPAAQLDSPYLLYCGRIDPSKGCQELLNYFIQFKKANPSDLRLVLTGKTYLDLPDRPDIEFRGFVSETEKLQLMAGATVFVMSSPYESFSIVTLEAMVQRTPVLVNGACQVLVEHVQRSHVGAIYQDYSTFAASLQQLLSPQVDRAALGEQARHYVLENYSLEVVCQRLDQAIAVSCAPQ